MKHVISRARMAVPPDNVCTCQSSRNDSACEKDQILHGFEDSQQLPHVCASITVHAVWEAFQTFFTTTIKSASGECISNFFVPCLVTSLRQLIATAVFTRLALLISERSNCSRLPDKAAFQLRLPFAIALKPWLTRDFLSPSLGRLPLQSLLSDTHPCSRTFTVRSGYEYPVCHHYDVRTQPRVCKR